MASLAVVISAYNEEKKLGRTLASVKWADEVIVVDNESTDSTAKMASSMGARVVKRKNNPMLNINKNYGFSVATSDWILSLDADEEVTPGLKKIIQAKIAETEVNGFWIPRKNIIFGKWIEHGLWWPDKQLRLFRRGLGTFPCKHVHEYLTVDGKTEELTEPYIHYNYETIGQFLHKMDSIYTENEVENLLAANYRLAWYDAIRFPVSDFLKIYFAQSGYKDGLHGLVLSILQAFYSFIVFVKLWERAGFGEKNIQLVAVSQEIKKTKAELLYWQLTASIAEERNFVKKLIMKIERRFAHYFI